MQVARIFRAPLTSVCQVRVRYSSRSPSAVCPSGVTAVHKIIFISTNKTVAVPPSAQPTELLVVVVVVVVVTFFNHNFVNCKATLIMAIKIYEIKYHISLNDVHT